MTRDRLPPGLTPGEIDAAVKASTQSGEAIYELDQEALRELEPDLIVTQELCPVCAVSYDEVQAMAKDLPTCPQVLALDPKTFGETMGDIRTVAQATDSKRAALDLIERQRRRVDAVKIAVKDAPRRTVVAVEWFDPVYIAGHWTPQLIELAGGVDLLGFAGEHSEVVTWEQVNAVQPDVVICMPCGYDAYQSLEQAQPFLGQLEATGAQTIVAVDAAAYFSRPGPRLVDGLELLAHVLHPGCVREAPGVALPVLGAPLA